ncbi:hypothetical protein IT6_09825 [Methylacidiphilum caldifontis]|uniref:hypothetical protein n=1 Tax=Methylacidiphilum caldifontis TaxID=2795386 RepID=UPI001A902EE0|nr:hypothetical protein IT6_09825 [Methylacidiphilum caldifontis]
MNSKWREIKKRLNSPMSSVRKKHDDTALGMHEFILWDVIGVSTRAHAAVLHP